MRLTVPIWKNSTIFQTLLLLGNLTISKTSKIINYRRTALAMIHRMDLQIGQMIQRLEKTGELDNTVIIFQADNGPMSWGTAWPLRGKKVAYAEGGIR